MMSKNSGAGGTFFASRLFRSFVQAVNPAINTEHNKAMFFIPAFFCEVDEKHQAFQSDVEKKERPRLRRQGQVEHDWIRAFGISYVMQSIGKTRVATAHCRQVDFLLFGHFSDLSGGQHQGDGIFVFCE